MTTPRSQLVTSGFVIALAVLVTVVFAVVVVRAQPHSRRTTPSRLRVDPFAVNAAATPGVFVTIEQDGRAAGRTLPAASFGLEAGQSLHRSIAPGPFDAIVEVVFRPGAVTAYLGAQIRGGQVQLESDGTILLADAAGPTPRLALTPQPVPLGSGVVKLIYHVRAKGDGPVAFRAVWRPESSLVPLPLPVSGTLLLDDPVLRGRQQIIELGCVSCHEAPGRDLARVQAPVLGDVGERVRPGWLRRWIDDPCGVKPGTTMPTLGISDWAIEDLTQFLVSLGGPMPEDGEPPEPALVRTGEVLYHRVGCFACHGPLVTTKASSKIWRSYTPLGPLGEKTTVTRLTAFLLDPHAARPGGRMPNLDLDLLEATAIASYLVSRNGDVGSPPPPPAASAFRVDPDRAASGRRLFGITGCANCHELGRNRTPVDGRRPAPPLASVAPAAGRSGTGCLEETPSPPGVWYDLPTAARRDIAAYLDELAVPVPPPVPLDDLLVDFRTMQCGACHAFHAEQGPEAAVAIHFETEGEADLGDEGRLPPTLSDAGARLTASWLHEVLEDESRARPYLAARMPRFGAANVAGLVDGFRAAAGAGAVVANEPRFTVEDATAGRRLVGAKALNCIQCHTIAGQDSTGTPGPDLALMPGRLTYESFAQWLHDPAQLRPGTRMPSFFVGGRGAFTDILGGQASAQVDAVWSYLSQGDQLALPEGLTDPTGFELVVGDEPVVFRTFMKSAGVRAIACGFPEQIHAAFDADRCELAAVWTGRFLSAQGAWGARGGAETNPADFAWTAPPVPLLQLATISPGLSETAVRFRGYRLDAARRPVFRYQLRQEGRVVTVEEAIAPRLEPPALVRRFALAGPPGQVVIVTASDLVTRGVRPDDAGGPATVVLDGNGRSAFEVEVTW